MVSALPDATQLERVERLTPYRIGLFVAAGVFTLLGALPWYYTVKADRALQWKESLVAGQWRRETLGREMMRARIRSERGGLDAEQAIERMNLAEANDPERPPAPRRVQFGPPLITTAAFLAAAASLVGAGGVRRQQLDEIQAISDTRRAARAREEAEQEARDTEQTDPQARANVTTQQIMPDEGPPRPNVTMRPIMPDDAEAGGTPEPGSG